MQDCKIWQIIAQRSAKVDSSVLFIDVSSYVEQEDTREVINIAEVNAKLETLVAEGNELNEKIEAIIKELGA